MSSPEEQAEELVVVVPSGGAAHTVELRGPGVPPVAVFHADNPAVVREMAEAVRVFVAAVIRGSSGRKAPPGRSSPVRLGQTRPGS